MVEEASLLAANGIKLGDFILLSKKCGPAHTKHDIGEDVEFPGKFIEAELVGTVALLEGVTESLLTLATASSESRVKVKCCTPLPDGSNFFHIRVSAA